MSKAQKPDLPLSPVELEIMKLMWKDGRVTARQLCDGMALVAEEAGKDSYAFSTISTYLERLRLKGYVDRKATGARKYTYFAVVSKEEIQRHMLKELEGLFDSGEEFLHKFADTANLSRSDRRDLKRFVKQLVTKPT